MEAVERAKKLLKVQELAVQAEQKGEEEYERRVQSFRVESWFVAPQPLETPMVVAL